MTDLIPEPGIGMLVALGAGILLGALVCAIPLIIRIGRLRTRVALLDTRLNSESELQHERERLLRAASEDLAVGLERSAARSMRSQGELLLQLAEAQLGKHHQKADLELRERQVAIEALVQPLKESIDKTRQQVAHIENERREAYGSLQSHLSLVAESQNLLRQETRNLVGALRRPEVRGQWGEITLRRVVELAGMKEYCDFETQAQVDKPNSRLRPDMVVRLPDERVLVIDVKTPLDAYLDAVEARDESGRDTAVSRHARIMRERVKELASKEYWSRFITVRSSL